MTLNEDAGCANPCGGEPMQCPTCSELGNTGKPHDKAFFSDLYADLERKGYSDEEIDDLIGRFD